jgi:hypothetical protein
VRKSSDLNYVTIWGDNKMNWIKSIFGKDINRSQKGQYFTVIMLMGIEFEPSSEDVDYLVQQERLSESDRIMAIKGDAGWITNKNVVKKIFYQATEKIAPNYTVNEMWIKMQNINGRPFLFVRANGN